MEPSARLIIRLGSQPEQQYPISQEITIVGREAINDLVVNDPEVSRRHCRLMMGKDGYLIEDLGSTNGTFVNGQRVTSPVPLYHGDTIELGKSGRIIFSVTPKEASQSAQQSDLVMEDLFEEDEDLEENEKPIVQSKQSRSQSQPIVRQSEVEGEDDEEEGRGFQRYLIGCGCLLLLLLFLVGAALFILDQTAPNQLYCGFLRPFWETVLGPVLKAFDRPLACP